MAMSPSSLLVLAGGLAMDAAAVSAARGLAVPVLRARHFALVAVFFGGFQALMPLLGWFLGRQLGPLVAAGTTGSPSVCLEESARRCSGKRGPEPTRLRLTEATPSVSR